mmetsp:Transcript_6033/g.17769  ORF Transcript_6033/g.17769 Transcript_6033/m.17769 type:complete len:586 (+) Transcript_6033:46-1803(+)
MPGGASSGAPELVLAVVELLQRVEGGANHAVLELSSVGVHLKLPRRGQVREGDKDLADAVDVVAVLGGLRDHHAHHRAVLRGLAVNLRGDVLVILVVHQVLLVDGVQELHDGGGPRANLASLLHLHCEHRVRDNLLRHGVGHRRGGHGSLLRLRGLRLSAELLDPDDVLAAHEAVEGDDGEVHVVRVVVLEDPVALDLACAQVADEAEHPQLAELAEQVAHNGLVHRLGQVEDGELRRRAEILTSSRRRIGTDQARQGHLVEVDLARGIAVLGDLVVVRPLDDHLVTLVLDAVQLHAHGGAVRGAELQLRRLPLLGAPLFLGHGAREDRGHVLVGGLLHSVGRHRQHGAVEELNQLLARDAEGEVLQDDRLLHHLLVRELGHGLLNGRRGRAAAPGGDGRHREASGVGAPLGLPLARAAVGAGRPRALLVLLLLLLLLAVPRGGALLLLDLVLLLLLRLRPLPLHVGVGLDFALHVGVGLGEGVQVGVYAFALHAVLALDLPLHAVLLLVLVDLLAFDATLALDVTLSLHVGGWLARLVLDLHLLLDALVGIHVHVIVSHLLRLHLGDFRLGGSHGGLSAARGHL